MGKLLSLLARDDSNCCSPQQKYDVFLDFENAQPSASEEVTWREVQRVLRSAQNVLDALQEYKGAGREIREAIATTGSAGGIRGEPGPAAADAQNRAWTTVGPLVLKLKDFYEFSAELERVVPKILQELCSGEMTPTQHLDTQQALVKQLAEILEFVLKFDELKMKTPAIQNDLSYYRRTMTRSRMGAAAASTQPEDAPTITNELANRMSLFYAHATPMLKVLSDATTRFVTEKAEVSRDNITETLSTMAKVCLRMLDTPNLIAQFQREETQLFVLRVMVGLVILYDHVHPHGAFVKASNVDVKGCVRLLKDQPASRSECLLNALRYTTKHLNEDATPKNIKALLAV